MTPLFSRLTPNLIVEEIETCLPFWAGLGFETTLSVPHGERLGFVILKHSEVELMLQSRASLEEDVPSIARDAYRSVLYLSVPDLDPLRKALEAAHAVVPERTTFYGAREIIVRDPAGNVLFFAAHT